jgi:hypothetical protein
VTVSINGGFLYNASNHRNIDNAAALVDSRTFIDETSTCCLELTVQFASTAGTVTSSYDQGVSLSGKESGTGGSIDNKVTFSTSTNGFKIQPWAKYKVCTDGLDHNTAGPVVTLISTSGPTDGIASSENAQQHFHYEPVEINDNLFRSKFSHAIQ